MSHHADVISGVEKTRLAVRTLKGVMTAVVGEGGEAERALGGRKGACRGGKRASERASERESERKRVSERES
eukprot:1437145-Pleurochrysis_carterae.AAC.1